MLSEKGIELQKILDYVVRLPQYKKDYQKGGPQETYCNLLARGVLDHEAARVWVKDYLPHEYNYDISFMNPGKSISYIMTMTMIKVAYDNVLRMSKSGIATAKTHDAILPPQAGKYPIEVDPASAQEYANEGVPIWVTSVGVGRNGHEAIVYPTGNAVDEYRGPMIAQAGGYNGIFWISEWRAFGEYYFDKNSDIKFFRFPLKG